MCQEQTLGVLIVYLPCGLVMHHVELLWILRHFASRREKGEY
jgi:hypothetical protein